MDGEKDMDGEAEGQPKRQASADVADEPRTDGAEDEQVRQDSEGHPAVEMLATGDVEMVLDAATAEVEAKADETQDTMVEQQDESGPQAGSGEMAALVKQSVSREVADIAEIAKDMFEEQPAAKSDMDFETEKEQPNRHNDADDAHEPKTDDVEHGQVRQDGEEQPTDQMLTTGDAEMVLEAAAVEVEAKVDESHGAEVEQPASTDAATVEEAAGEMEVDAEAAAPPVGASQAWRASQAAAPRRTRKSTGAKRKRDADLDNLKQTANRLEREAERAKQVLTESEAAFKNAKDVFDAAVRAATKARQEVIVHEMPEAHEKPSHPYNLFCRTVGKSPAMANIGSGAGQAAKRLAKMWAELPEAEKKVYRDRSEEQRKRYLAWEQSEEGKAILGRRAEILAQQRSSSGSVGTKQTSTDTSKVRTEPDAECDDGPVSPEKKAKAVEARATPVKQRAAPRTPLSTPQAVVPGVEESILEEATKLSLKTALLNLVGRPDVQALKKSSQELLDALKSCDGMVNAAKRRLMEA